MSNSTPMSSSTSHNVRRQNRNSQQRRAPIVRSKSLMGALKDIVTAPLAWFGAADEPEPDFGDSDAKGKRRRTVNGAAKQPLGDRDNAKRIRVHSPDRQIQSSNSNGYLDPPGNAFQSQSQPQYQPPVQPQVQAPPVVRAASVSIPPTTIPYQQRSLNNISRRTISPLVAEPPPPRAQTRSFSQIRAGSSSMLVDPPAHQGQTKDVRMRSFREDLTYRTSMSVSRDTPPASTFAHPSFRMRTSMTPQPFPTPREMSEPPPPLPTLQSNPVFVRGPSQPQELPQLPPQPIVTLGSLVESRRSTRSPVRQHSSNSLLFSDAPTNPVRPVIPRVAEKVLHELDIYRTPLVPTRLRVTTTLTSTSTHPQMFRSRRTQPLILMHEEEEKDKSQKEGKGKKKVNDTKPYAGQGGMKKLLARRREEVEEEEEQGQNSQAAGSSSTTTDAAMVGETRQEEPQPVLPPPTPPKMTEPDWFTTQRNQAPSSSLRVGRTKTSRNHIVRPAAPASKNRTNTYSAAFDDDSMEMDGAVDLDTVVSNNENKERTAMEEEGGDDAEEQREKEFKMLEEASKKLPVFNIPAGFTFAKETAAPPIQYDPDAKEPPLASLPFSFSQPSTSASAPTPAPVPVVPPQEPAKTAPAFGFSFGQPPTNSTSSSSSFFGTPPTTTPPANTEPPKSVFAQAPVPTPASPVPAPAPAPTSTSGIPNFFANHKPTLPPPPAPLIFSSTTPTPPVPLKDAENPFWEGEKKEAKQTDSKSNGGLFSAFSTGAGTSTGPAEKPNGTSLFGNGGGGGGASFGTGPSLSIFGSAIATKQPPLFGTGTDTAPPPKPVEVSALAPSFSFAKPTATESSEASKPAVTFSAFSQPSTSTTPGASSSYFGAPLPAAVVTTPSVPPPSDTPKSLFGSSGGAFSFGPPKDDAKTLTTTGAGPSSNPFSFGAPPNTPPPAAADKTTSSMFQFAPPVAPAPAPAPAPFSFGAPSADSSKSFAFGAPMAAPARTVTPPRSEQEFRMEESPTRDTNGKQEETRSFGFPSSGPAFGAINGASSSSSPFAFGATNSFGTKEEPKKEEIKPATAMGFGSNVSGFGQTQSTSGSAFSFGQASKPVGETPRPATSGSFFQPSSTPTSSPFAFGTPSNSTGGNSNPFGQQQHASSTPSSPSTFNQPSPFAFAPPNTAPATSFAFGSSQPASPASGSPTIAQQPPPPPSGGGGFGFGPGAASSAFGAPAPAAAPSPGGSLFTIGAPPAAPPTAGGRQIRKLPNRRLAKR